MFLKSKYLFLALFVIASSSLLADPYIGMPTSTTRYATDAYPGFDREDQIGEVTQKEPRWFSWINGPREETAEAQWKWANECMANESWRAARRAYDALVRQWPASPEAPLAQEALADFYLNQEHDYIAAFDEYKYLLDFYSSSCDYFAIAERLYRVACLMREDGKSILFFRFANTTDVRRAFEAVVLRAPGATYAPEVMATIATLREEEGEFEKAIQVYETLRNIYPATPEAHASFYDEARVRMMVLREHAYNRMRCRDTYSFLKNAFRALPEGTFEDAKKEEMLQWLNETVLLLEQEAFQAAMFYDSRTRTRHSAIAAYEKYLEEFPQTSNAARVRSRLEELKAADAAAEVAKKTSEEKREAEVEKTNND